MAGLGGFGGLGGGMGSGVNSAQQQEQMRLMEIMQEMQVADSLRMYNELVQRCFGHCVDSFRSRKLDGKEVCTFGSRFFFPFHSLTKKCTRSEPVTLFSYALTILLLTLRPWFFGASVCQSSLICTCSLLGASTLAAGNMYCQVLWEISQVYAACYAEVSRTSTGNGRWGDQATRFIGLAFRFLFCKFS